MRPIDWDPSQDPQTYLEQLDAWEAERDRLAAAQADASAAFVTAQARAVALANWAASLATDLSAVSGQAGQLAANAAARATLEAQLTRVAGEIEDHQAARELATARLLAGPSPQVPLVLLPLRLETRWLDDVLHVRIYPDDIGLDTHDPSLTDDELRWADHFWQVRSGAAAADQEETWQQLVRRFGPARAAWLVQATAPGQPTAAVRSGPWPQPAQARVLPDRFAVVALSGGLPINLAAADATPRYVSWTSPVADPLPLSPLEADPAAPPWWQDLAAARAAGMAVAIPVPKGAPPIEALAVLGVRSERSGAPAGAALEALLAGHTFSSGVELLASGTPTNNSGDLRSAHGSESQERAARSVRDAVLDGAPAVAADQAGGRLAMLLGLPVASLAPLAGSTAPHDVLMGAARLVVGLGARGALRDRLGPQAAAAWPLLEPAGPAPALRVGRQPYGVLPTTAPGRWQPLAGEAGSVLTDALHEWAAASGPPLMVDPAAPPSPLGGGPARRVTRDDDADLAALLLESAHSLQWTSGDPATGADVDGLDALVGPLDGETSAAHALPILASTMAGDLAGLPAAVRTGSLLARIAVAAKGAASPGDIAAVDAALGTLAVAERNDLARVVHELLDASSHRFDAWVTAVATERLEALRRDQPGSVAVGAFGWLTDVAPRTVPRSFGHVHAPSLAQASTAAVLRSAYLGQRRRAWMASLDSAAAEVRELEAQQGAAGSDPQATQASLSAARSRLALARDGLDRLAPLDAVAEERLPLAIDLSSRRVRGALWMLSAVRAGQPLAAVLGYQFERDLADAGLHQHLAAFRKLTRFHTGTALEKVEQVRRDREADLVAARAALADRQRAVVDLQGPLAAAEDSERAAAARAAEADAAYLPFQKLQAERATEADEVDQRMQELAAIDADRPKPVDRPFHVNLPPNVP
ncbi:MAG TPA: hypothetical protein VMW35_21540 [Myxococcota bacterium]|nr:hypothetical protein [Myxococcota bacterium]